MEKLQNLEERPKSIDKPMLIFFSNTSLKSY